MVKICQGGDCRINEGERGDWGELGGDGGSQWESCSSFSCYENWGYPRVYLKNKFQRRQKDKWRRKG